MARRWLCCRDGTPTQAPLSPSPSFPVSLLLPLSFSLPPPLHPSFTLSTSSPFLALQPTLAHPLFLSHCCSFPHFCLFIPLCSISLSLFSSLLHSSTSFFLYVCSSFSSSLPFSFQSSLTLPFLADPLFLCITHFSSLTCSISFSLAISHLPTFSLLSPLLHPCASSPVHLPVYYQHDTDNYIRPPPPHPDISLTPVTLRFFPSVSPPLSFSLPYFQSPGATYIFSFRMYVRLGLIFPAALGPALALPSFVHGTMAHLALTSASLFLRSFCTCSLFLLFFAVVPRNRLAFPAQRTPA